MSAAKLNTMRPRSNLILETDRMWLVNCDLVILEHLFAGEAKLGDYLGIEIPSKWTEFGEPAFRWTWDALHRHPGTERYWSYLPVLKSENMLVGSCGFKGPPTAAGVVELGYEIAEAYRGRGLATEAVHALVQQAFAEASVVKVQAHTLAEANASNHILQKCGFDFAGEVHDPDDGVLWKWDIGRERQGKNRGKQARSHSAG